MTTTNAMRLASVVTAIDVLVASGFSIVGIIHPQYLVPVESVPTEASLLLAMYAAARTIPLALFALAAIYKRATPALLILGALAGAMQLLDAGIGLFEHDLGKCAGPLFIAVLQFFVVYLLHRPGKANIVFGWIFTGHQIGAAAAAYGAGLMRTSVGSYLPAFFSAGAFCILAAALIIAIGSNRKLDMQPV